MSKVKLKNYELARKLRTYFLVITILGIIGLGYCSYKIFFFDHKPYDGTPIVYSIYALMIACVVAPIASLGVKIEEGLKNE